MQIEPFIKELLQEHKIILNLLKEIHAYNINADEGMKKVKQLKEVLLNHLKKEDEEFYPYLREKAKTDKSLKVMVDLFAHEIEDMSPEILNFFDNFLNKKHVKLAVELGKIKGILKGRIIREETILFKRAV